LEELGGGIKTRLEKISIMTEDNAALTRADILKFL
jgi:hypothetical protein